MNRNSPKNLFAISIILIAFVFAVGKIFALRSERQRLELIRENIRSIAVEDDALVLEILSAGESSEITFAEYFKRTEKNKSDRDSLIRRLRIIEPEFYKETALKFVRLLELENDWVRSQESLVRAEVAFETASQDFKNAVRSEKGKQAKVNSALDSYLASQGGINEKLKFDSSIDDVKSTQSTVRTTALDFENADEDLKEKANSACQTTARWLDTEDNQFFSSIELTRDIRPGLERLKSKQQPNTDDVESLNSPFATAPAIDSKTKATPFFLDLVLGEKRLTADQKEVSLYDPVTKYFLLTENMFNHSDLSVNLAMNPEVSPESCKQSAIKLSTGLGVRIGQTEGRLREILGTPADISNDVDFDDDGVKDTAYHYATFIRMPWPGSLKKRIRLYTAGYYFSRGKLVRITFLVQPPDGQTDSDASP